MKNRKKRIIRFAIAIVGLIFIASVLTFGAHLYKRQNTPDCSDATPLTQNTDPSHELTFCDQYAMTPGKYKDDFYERGWPYSYNAAAPEHNSGDSELDKLHQSEYEQQRQAAIGANFAVYLVALTAAYGVYSLVRSRYAHHRH